MHKVTLVCGITGAGKTTYAAGLGVPVIAWDAFSGGGYDKTARCNAEAAAAGVDVAVDGIYTRAASRRALIEACKGAYLECIWMDTPVGECVRRCPEHETRIRGHAATFEPPSYAEGWDTIKRVAGAED